MLSLTYNILFFLNVATPASSESSAESAPTLNLLGLMQEVY